MRRMQKLVAVSCLVAANAIQAAFGLEVSNSVISLGISATKGSSIDSFKVLGFETVDNNDLGRQIQASLFFPYAFAEWYTCPTNGVTVFQGSGVNPQESGDICGIASNVFAIGLGPAGSGEINVGSEPRDWAGRGLAPPGLQIEGHHKVGPLPYINAPEVALLNYYFISHQQNLTFSHVGPTVNGPTPVPFVPAIYFKGDVLTKLYGLSMDGSTWTDLSSSVASGNDYTPSHYRFRAMAWMRTDLGWGVALYGRSTLNQSCGGNTFSMAQADQQGQCPNFVAQRFPNSTPGVVGGTNNLSLVDQALTTVPAGTFVSFKAHLVVGNLGTIQNFVNTIYNAGH